MTSLINQYSHRAHGKIIPGNATTWTTDESLTLKIGARYKMQVSAVNGAGLTATHYTNGVMVDPTPPQVCPQRGLAKQFIMNLQLMYPIG